MYESSEIVYIIVLWHLVRKLHISSTLMQLQQKGEHDDCRDGTWPR